MKEYKYIIVGSTEELNLIEHAINSFLMCDYSATPKRLKSCTDSITFSVSLCLMWAESFETVLTRALRKGLKNTSVYNSSNWFVDIL